MPFVRLEDIQFSYDPLEPVVDDVHWNIGRGEIHCLLGRSGCGKTTLLKIAAGLISPARGRVFVNDETIVEPHPRIALVFQSPTLLEWRTVLDNVCLPLSLSGRVTEAQRRRAVELLALVGLQGLIERRPGELSGGQQSRVAIARALIADPWVLLMDEPFGALDALTREEMALEVLRIWTEEPKTILFVTHSITEAVLLADRVVVMSPRPGRIAEIININLPRPRTFKIESHHEFQQSTQRIRELIFGNRDEKRIVN